MASKQKEELGKGIRALLRDMEPGEGKAAAVRSMAGVNEIPLTSVEVNPFQPRADFDETGLRELADSIRIHGVIQPITVRRLNSGQYQLISGERRLRARKMVGKRSIPAYIRVANDQEMLEIALIENIQREDLNAMEIAINYQRLLDECELKHDQLAHRVGKNRSTVTNYLRLLRLPPEIQDGLKAHRIAMGHARAILSLDDPVAQLDLFRATLREDLSVRQVEKRCLSYKGKRPSVAPKKINKLSPALQRMQDDLSGELSARVQLRPGKGERGELVIAYHDEEELHRLAELLKS